MGQKAARIDAEAKLAQMSGMSNTKADIIAEGKTPDGRYYSKMQMIVE